MDNVRYAIVIVLLAVAVLRHIDFPNGEEIPAGQQAVAGVLHELSSLELSELFQYDSIRTKALNELRKDDSLRFTPPEWFVSEMKKLNNASVQEARVGFENASVRLFRRQSGSAYDSGIKAVRTALGGPDEENLGKCEDCDGTGKIGDGRVFVDCLACGGDGKIDDSDLKGGNPFEINEVSNQRKAGDQVSRMPVGVIAGSSCGGTRSRVVFPSLRRLFER